MFAPAGRRSMRVSVNRPKGGSRRRSIEPHVGALVDPVADDRPGKLRPPAELRRDMAVEPGLEQRDMASSLRADMIDEHDLAARPHARARVRRASPRAPARRSAHRARRRRRSSRRRRPCASRPSWRGRRHGASRSRRDALRRRGAASARKDRRRRPAHCGANIGSSSPVPTPTSRMRPSRARGDRRRRRGGRASADVGKSDRRSAPSAHRRPRRLPLSSASTCRAEDSSCFAHPGALRAVCGAQRRRLLTTHRRSLPARPRR